MECSPVSLLSTSCWIMIVNLYYYNNVFNFFLKHLIFFVQMGQFFITCGYFSVHSHHWFCNKWNSHELCNQSVVWHLVPSGSEEWCYTVKGFLDWIWIPGVFKSSYSHVSLPEYRCSKCNFAQWWIQDFPLGDADPLGGGGADLQGSSSSVKMNAKMKEYGAIGWGRVVDMPLDPPIVTVWEICDS